MKLLVITASYPPHQVGGYEMRCRDVIEALKKKGHQILTLTTRCEDKQCDLHAGELQVERKLLRRESNQSVFSQIYHDCKEINFIDQVTKDFQPDIIYLWAIQNLSHVILPYFSAHKTPIVYDEGGSGLVYLTKINKRGLYFYNNENDSEIKKGLKTIINKLAMMCSNNLIDPSWSWPNKMNMYFNSNSSMNYAKENGVFVDFADVIRSGINLSTFRYMDRIKIKSPVNIIVPGRIKPIKGVMDCILLVLKLLDVEIITELTIIGKVQDENYFDELRTTIKREHLSTSITFVPMVSQNELAKLYTTSDICFCPSYLIPGLSRVPLEAMASGSLVITYGNEGSSEIIVNKETGFIVPEGDVDAVTKVIASLVNDPKVYRTIIAQARKQVEKNYSLAEYVDDIERFLLERV